VTAGAPAATGITGVFGGSFNPPHLAHVLAVAVAIALAFARPSRDWVEAHYSNGLYPPIDGFVRAASARGIEVMLVPTGFAPLWAQGPSPGAYGGRYDSYFAWEPSNAQFGAFVHALGVRYSGPFSPRGVHTPLPRVSSTTVISSDLTIRSNTARRVGSARVRITASTVAVCVMPTN